MNGLWITVYVFSSLAQLSWGRSAVCTVGSGYYICGVKGYDVPECVNGHPCGRKQYRSCVRLISRDPDGFLLGRNTTRPVLDNQKGETRYRRSVAAGDTSGRFTGELIETDFKGLAGMKYRVFGLGEKSDNETVTRTRESVNSVENIIKSIILEQRLAGEYDLAKLQTDIEEQTIRALGDIRLMKVKLNISSCEDENKIKNGNLNLPSITIIAITDCNCRNRNFRSDENESESSGTGKIFDYTYEKRTDPGIWAKSASSESLAPKGTPPEKQVSASFTQSTGIATDVPENNQTAAKIESTTGRNAAEWSTVKTSQLLPTVRIPQTTQQTTQRQTTTLERSTESSTTAGSDVTFSKSTENPRTAATSAGTNLESPYETNQSTTPSQTTQQKIQTSTLQKITHYTTTSVSNKTDSKSSAASVSTNMATTPSFKTGQSVKPSETVSLSQTTQRQPATVEKFTSTIASGTDIHDSRPSTQPSQTNTAFMSAKVTTPSSLTTGQPTESPNKNEVFLRKGQTSEGVPASASVPTATSVTVPNTSVKEEPTTKINYIETTVRTTPLIKPSTTESSTAGVYTDVKKPSSTPTSSAIAVNTSPYITTVKLPPSTNRINETTATTAGLETTFGGKGRAFHCPSVGFFRDPNDCHSFYRCKREVVKCSNCDSRTWKLVRSRHTCMNGKWFSISFLKCVQAKPLNC